jgi:hypothetical protein
MKNIPNEIYLNLGDIDEQEFKELDFEQCWDNITWSDTEFDEFDIKFVRPVVHIDQQVRILEKVLDKLVTVSGEDKMDFILDICNEYKKQITTT